MPEIPIERIKQVKSFPSLVKFLRDELNWPLSADEIDELVFEYEPDELGIDPEVAVKIKEIKQLRPLAANQPWGIFYISFEPKHLPVVVLRRILQKLVIKKRQTAKSAHRNAWELHDLLFISSYGEESQRSITFAHFREDEESKLPTLRVVGWDSQDTPLHIDRCISELENLTFDEEISPDDWRKKWSKAFTLRHREVISTSKALAKELADLAGRIRKRVNRVLAIESEKGPMRQLYKAFQETLVHDLSKDDFADMYAQTITYGLFTTKKSRTEGLVADNLVDMVPRTNPFLRELLSTFLTIGGRKGKIDFDELGIDDVVQTLRDTDMDAVMRDFGDSKPEEDPVIHFYEDFLKQYDAKKKVKRGVFYTPKPVVSFIVRSVHEILQKDFGLKYGLADTTTWGEIAKRNKDIKIPEGVSENDPFVQILDPAAGTGTFLVEVIDIIYKTMKNKWEKEGHMPLEFGKLWNEYVPKHLLPRLYGFELMMAPYAIAHMKIGLKLFETGYRFRSDERARIYLTNTLEEPKDITEYFEQAAPALAHEAQAANKVKTNVPTTVIIGNPPYAGLSANMNPWIDGLLKGQIPNGPKVRSYYEVDGKPLGERKLWLQDDYVKFIRYGQFRLDSTGIGVLGLITNHAYLDNPTFRGMRQALLESFDNLNFTDLHGNAKKKEKAPDGSKDENVFDIQQGVGICLLRNTTNSEQPLVSYASFWGGRENKYKMLLQNTAYKVDFSPLTPNSPFYFFVPREETNREEYEQNPKLNEVMEVNTTGVVTARDDFVVDFEDAAILERISALRNHNISDEKLRKTYFVGKGSSKYPDGDTRGWKLPEARKKLRQDNGWENNLENYFYRPFDVRRIYYANWMVDWPRSEIMYHMTKGLNIGIYSCRQISGESWQHILPTNDIIDDCYVSNKTKERGYLFPLYLYPTEGELVFTDGDWSAGKGDLKKTFGPEDILSYIYAVFHSPTYRSRYAEFLKIDFPRVPITSNVDMFGTLCGFGSELVSLHLMESDKLNDHITTFPVSGDNTVTKVGETGRKLKDIKNGKGKLFINKTQYFDNLPEVVWNFHIGGYQVCHKWLKDRKGRKLSKEDIEHYHKIVVAINETIKIMKQIDEVINSHGAWPIK